MDMPTKKNAARAQAQEGRRRVVIEAVWPQVDGGAFPIKRARGEQVAVEADAFADGHDVVVCRLRHRRVGARAWQETPMQALGNDRWQAVFTVDELGLYEYTVAAWIDPFLTWQHDLVKRMAAGQDLRVEWLIGAQWLAQAAAAAKGTDGDKLKAWVGLLQSAGGEDDKRTLATSAEFIALATRHMPARFATVYPLTLRVRVEPLLARASAWYEFFPRSCRDDGRHASFKDCSRRLDDVAAMGFDVVYLPPIHPIGRSFRKGKNNTLEPGADDVGSPWAIGAKEGGHKAVHPQLGTLDDFRAFVKAAHARKLHVALDIALQCAPDHPYVKQHPEWFRTRPDGTVQYAENPPKKYQDIYPFDFESADWAALWDELKGIFLFWIEQGVKIFRVDNPHTKPFGFWAWCLDEIKRAHPDVIFLSEAFTRPKIMHRLAKLGFTQSYTYFTWRNTKAELSEYFTELSRAPSREYFWPNVWPNTPDILHAYLQTGGRPAFAIRAVLAATLCANYGIYGPAFELADNEPLKPGSEEYLHSEKYEIKRWDVGRSDSLRGLLTQLNKARHEHPALAHDWSLTFHTTDNEHLLCYSKRAGDDVVLVVVNLDFRFEQSGWTALDLAALDVAPDAEFTVRDLIDGGEYRWRGARNFVKLDPRERAAHVFVLQRGPA